MFLLCLKGEGNLYYLSPNFMKILILVNTLQSVNTFVYGNHIEFISYTKLKFPKDKIYFYNPYRMSIDRARNTAAKLALDNKCDYLMFVDDDVLVPKNAFEALYNSKKSVAAGLTYVRTYPFDPMVFKEKNKKLLDKTIIRDLVHFEPPKNTLTECYAVGFSCALIDTDILKALAPPYFVTGTYQTEDIYFCCKAKAELKPKPKIFVDSRVHTYHFLTPEAVGPTNVKLLRKLYKPSISRGLGYLDLCLKQLD